MIVVGDKSYQLKLSKLAYSFRGALSMQYLQDQGYGRILDLTDHAEQIAKELNSGK